MSTLKRTPGRKKSLVPKYRLHRASGQAVVTVGGRDVYLGRHGTEDSRRKYGEIIAKVAAGQPATVQPDAIPASGPTVDEITVRFLDHADRHYRKHGKPTSEIHLLKSAVAPLHERYGAIPAEAFGPKLLKEYRELLVARGLVRGTVNAFVGRIRRIFRYAVAEEMIGPEAYQRLAAVDGLRRGRTEAKESEPVRPVGDVALAAVLAHVPNPVNAMIRVQRLTGMRPGELCGMRWEDIDTTGDVWLYRPREHKLQHHGRDRVVAIGPQGQTILTARRGLRVQLTGPVFPGKRGPFTVAAYRRAIARGCELAFGMPDNLTAVARRKWRETYVWHPNQLRHSFATELRKLPGVTLDTVAATLGHSQLSTSQVYAELDTASAASAVLKIG